MSQAVAPPCSQSCREQRQRPEVGKGRGERCARVRVLMDATHLFCARIGSPAFKYLQTCLASSVTSNGASAALTKDAKAASPGNSSAHIRKSRAWRSDASRVASAGSGSKCASRSGSSTRSCTFEPGGMLNTVPDAGSSTLRRTSSWMLRARGRPFGSPCARRAASCSLRAESRGEKASVMLSATTV
eukprot:scaffold218437_cov28-Tisochrysis_lutea.AAC.4